MKEKEPKFEKLPKVICGIEKKKEIELCPENREIIEDIITHPASKKILAKYEIFSDYYFGNKLKLKKEELQEKGIKLPTKEEIKERANQIFLENSAYKDILKLGEQKKGKWTYREEMKNIFIKYVAKELKENELTQLKKTKGGKSKKKFYETVQDILINRSIKEEKGIRIGKLYVTIEGENEEMCYFHIPHFAKDWKEVLQELIIAHKLLANEYLPKDERFKNVEKITGISWVFGDEKKAKSFDSLFRWNHYTDEEIELFCEDKNSDEYRNFKFLGAKNSPKLFEKYLVEGEIPKVGGRWISKKELIEKY